MAQKNLDKATESFCFADFLSGLHQCFCFWTMLETWHEWLCSQPTFISSKCCETWPGKYFIISSNVFLALICLSSLVRSSLLSQNTASAGINHKIELSYIRQFKRYISPSSDSNILFPSCVCRSKSEEEKTATHIKYTKLCVIPQTPLCIWIYFPENLY